MAAEREPDPECLPFVARDGTVYHPSRFHHRSGRLVICPVCDCRPCAVGCPEQMNASVPWDRPAVVEEVT